MRNVSQDNTICLIQNKNLCVKTLRMWQEINQLHENKFTKEHPCTDIQLHQYSFQKTQMSDSHKMATQISTNTTTLLFKEYFYQCFIVFTYINWKDEIIPFKPFMFCYG